MYLSQANVILPIPKSHLFCGWCLIAAATMLTLAWRILR